MFFNEARRLASVLAFFEFLLAIRSSRVLSLYLIKKKSFSFCIVLVFKCVVVYVEVFFVVLVMVCVVVYVVVYVLVPYF